MGVAAENRAELGENLLENNFAEEAEVGNNLAEEEEEEEEEEKNIAGEPEIDPGAEKSCNDDKTQVPIDAEEPTSKGGSAMINKGQILLSKADKTQVLVDAEDPTSKISRSPAAPSPSPLEIEDMLSEILARLPPQPSSLPRASAVCKRWRGLVTDPRFIGCFRLRHRRTPPLVGFFDGGPHAISFFPTLEAPNRVPSGRFSLHLDDYSWLLGCRHGLALILDRKPTPGLLVWDPVTGEQHHLAIPPGFDPTDTPVSGAVLRSAAGDVQVQHFQVVLLAAEDKGGRMLACVYSSETEVWGNLISTRNPSYVHLFMRAVLVENSLYWLFGTETSLAILEFDLERQSLAVVQLPPGLDILPHEVDIRSELDLYDMCTVMQAEGGGLGFLFVSYFTAQAQLWKRNTDRDGVVSWELTRAIELDKLLSLNYKKTQPLHLLGYAEYNNVLLLRRTSSIFTVQLESLKFKKFPTVGNWSYFHPFESVYTAGIGGGHGGSELLHNA